MPSKFPDQASYLELGLVVFSGLVVGSIALWLGGVALNEAHRWRRHAQPPPSVGTISAERHQNITSVSTR